MRQAWGSGSPVGCKWAELPVFYCEWCSLSETGLRPEAPRSSWHPDQRISSIQPQVKSMPVTHTLFNTHPHLSFHFLSQTPSLSRTHGWREHFSTSHLCRRGLFDSRLRIRFCVLLHSYSDWLMHLRVFFTTVKSY